MCPPLGAWDGPDRSAGSGVLAREKASGIRHLEARVSSRVQGAEREVGSGLDS